MNRYKTLAAYKSRSDPRKEFRYRVVVDNKTGEVMCQCPGFTYRGKCWHVLEWTPERLAERYK